jgi:hypothetical protein
MGGKSFTIPCILSRNGCGVKTTTLANSKANAFTLISVKCAKKLSKFLNTPFEKLERPIPVKGYNGQSGTPITSVLRIHLRVDGRRQYNVPFLITDLGHHDVILGRKWLAYLDLWLDVRNQQLIWPTNLPPTPSFIKEIIVTMKRLLETALDPAHQADATRRDQALQKEIELGKISILRRPQTQNASATTSPKPTTTAVNTQPLIALDGFHPLGGGNQNASVRKPWTPKGIERHIELLDQQDNLRKMEYEL